MKKTITLLAALMLLVFNAVSQVSILTNDGYATAYGTGSEVDLNNDGYLDLMYCGELRDNTNLYDDSGNMYENANFNAFVRMYNPITKTYDATLTNYFLGARSTMVFTDIDQDGTMDIVAGEFWKNKGSWYRGGIYKGNGDGTFKQVQATFDDPNFVFMPSAVAVADLNNDGLPDIITGGCDVINNETVSRAGILINKGNNSFHVAATTDLFGSDMLNYVIIKTFDFNNDGFMDFAIQGVSNNDVKINEVYKNDGASNPGHFTPLNLSNIVLPRIEGGFNIADFNGDGWLDLFFSGDEVTGASSHGSCAMKVLINDQHGSFTVKDEPNLTPDLRQWCTTPNITRTYDWDGDGYPDLIVPGHQPADKGGLNTQLAYIYLNDGTGTFSSGTRVPGATEGNILFPDWNGDGVRDYLVQGQSWDNSVYPEVGKVAAVMINSNTTVNERPTAPTGLKANVNGHDVQLSWNAGSDSKTPAASLSYEYYIKDANGKFYTDCRSHVGGALDGIRKVLELGNAMLNKSVKLYNLPDGTYTWGVQSIDACYDGSTFSTGSFNVSTTGINNVNADNINIWMKGKAVFISANQPVTASIYSVSGSFLQSLSGKQQYEPVLNEGIYIIKANTDKGSVVRKVIVK